MFNVGGGELLVILLIALIVLGPQKLPEAARQIGGFARELRRMSSAFQDELRTALDEPVEEDARQRGRRVVSSDEQPSPVADTPATDDDQTAQTRDPDEGGSPSAVAASGDEPLPEPDPEPAVSTAEAAGMYDIKPEARDDEPAGS